MFSIYDGRNHFFQWDLNQKLIIEDSTITEVHFCNRTDDCALVCEVYKEEGLNLVNVPNILLQKDWTIRVYAVAADHTKYEERFKVCPRSKPADYVYTETECKTFELLEKRMEELESAVSVEGVEKAVKDYLTENPPEAGATAEERAQIAQNAADIKELQEKEVDLNDYYTKEQTENIVSSAIGEIEIPSIEGLASEEYVDQAIKNIDIPGIDLTPYAKKEDIPNIEGLASEEYVDQAIRDIEVPEVPENISAFNNDAGYQTAAEVAAIVQRELGVIENGAY